jgi:hypothetical protein
VVKVNGFELLKRLWRPAHPAFWMMIILNVATGGLTWMAQHPDLIWPLRLLIAVFAFGNFWLGLKFMRILLRRDPDQPR